MMKYAGVLVALSLLVLNVYGGDYLPAKVAVSGSKAVAVGKKIQLIGFAVWSDGDREQVSPSSTWGSRAKWASSDKSIATVSSNGVVTGVKGGTVTINFSYKDCNGNTLKTSHSMTVKKTLSKISVSGEKTVFSGAKIKLTGIAHYNDGSKKANATFKWSSSDPAIAVIAANGTVTGKKAGNAVITAKYTEGSVTKTATWKVCVKKKLKSLSVSGPKTVNAGKKITLGTTALFTDASKAEVKSKWSSSNAEIATISQNGVVTGKKAGNVVITAKYAEDGVTKTATWKVCVKKQLEGISVSGPQAVNVGKKITLGAAARFTDGSKAKVNSKWSSSNPEIATISANGEVTGKKAGEVVITAKYTFDGTTKTGKRTITVK